MDTRPFILILARSAQLRSSLEVLVAASPRIQSIRAEEDLQSVNALAETIQPALVILSGDEGAESSIAYIQSRWPATPLIVLVDSEGEFEPLRAASAQVVLVKGIRAAKLLSVVESLLPAA